MKLENKKENGTEVKNEMIVKIYMGGKKECFVLSEIVGKEFVNGKIKEILLKLAEAF